jgi:hypothetical protein
MRPTTDAWRQVVYAAFDFAPFPEQQEVLDWWFASDSPFLLLCGGEGAGKSLLSSVAALCCMGAPGEYWIVGPDYRQARPEFLYIHDALQRMDALDGEASMPQSDNTGWSMKTKWGARISTRTSSDITKLASFQVRGWIMAEANQHPYEAWLKLLGRSMRNAGGPGFGILSGTLEQGLPWYEDLLERWKGDNELGARSFSLPSWINRVLYPQGRNDPKIKMLEANTPPDLFMERYGATPRTSWNAVLPEFDIKTHVRKLEVVKDVPVELAVDPAKHTYVVLFVQTVGQVTNVLDRVYAKKKIVHDVIPLVKENPLFQLVDKQNAGAIDFAGNQEAGNKSQVQLWQELAGCSFGFRYIPLETTIDILRYRLGSNNSSGNPLVYFDSSMTNQRGPDGSAYDVLAEPKLWKWRERGPNQNTLRKPVDAHNDAMKALAYYCVHKFGLTETRKGMGKARRRGYWGVSDSDLAELERKQKGIREPAYLGLVR